MRGVKSKWRIVNLTNAAAVPSLSVWTPLLFSQASDLQDCQNNDTACDRSRSADYGIYGKVPNFNAQGIYAKHLHELCCPGLAFPQNFAILSSLVEQQSKTSQEW